MLSIDWRGRVYDCDFNQMLEMPMGGEQAVHIRDLAAIDPDARQGGALK